jgi:hypothetical protein
MNPKDIARLITEDPDIPDEYMSITEFLVKFPKVRETMSDLEAFFRKFGQRVELNPDSKYAEEFEPEENQKQFATFFLVKGKNQLGEDVTLFELRPTFDTQGKLTSLETASYWVDGGYTWDPTELLDISYGEWIKGEDNLDLSTLKDQGSDLYNILAWHAVAFPQMQNEQNMSNEVISKFRHTTALKSNKIGVYVAEVDTSDAKGVSVRWPARSGQEALEELEERGYENIKFVNPPMTDGDLGMPEGSVENMIKDKENKSGDWWKTGEEAPEWGEDTEKIAKLITDL